MRQGLTFIGRARKRCRSAGSTPAGTSSCVLSGPLRRVSGPTACLLTNRRSRSARLWYLAQRDGWPAGDARNVGEVRPLAGLTLQLGWEPPPLIVGAFAEW